MPTQDSSQIPAPIPTTVLTSGNVFDVNRNYSPSVYPPLPPSYQNPNYSYQQQPPLPPPNPQQPYLYAQQNIPPVMYQEVIVEPKLPMKQQCKVFFMKLMRDYLQNHMVLGICFRHRSVFTKCLYVKANRVGFRKEKIDSFTTCRRIAYLLFFVLCSFFFSIATMYSDIVSQYNCAETKLAQTQCLNYTSTTEMDQAGGCLHTKNIVRVDLSLDYPSYSFGDKFQIISGSIISGAAFTFPYNPNADPYLQATFEQWKDSYYCIHACIPKAPQFVLQDTRPVCGTLSEQRQQDILCASSYGACYEYRSWFNKLIEDKILSFIASFILFYPVKFLFKLVLSCTGPRAKCDNLFGHGCACTFYFSLLWVIGFWVVVSAAFITASLKYFGSGGAGFRFLQGLLSFLLSLLTAFLMDFVIITFRFLVMRSWRKIDLSYEEVDEKENLLTRFINGIIRSRAKKDIHEDAYTPNAPTAENIPNSTVAEGEKTSLLTKKQE